MPNPKPLQLEGMVETTSHDDGTVGDWRREKQQYEDQIRSFRRELADANDRADRMERGIKNLRTILGPIYNGIRIIFGEIELAVGAEISGRENGAQPSAQAGDPRWESYKRQFGGVPEEIIDALLTHKSMSTKQLGALLKHGYNTIWAAADKLRQAGALQNSGDGWSLKR